MNQNKPLDSEQITYQLRSLGVKNGDVLLVTADLVKVGLSNKNRRFLMDSWFSILTQLVGVDGTLVIVSFTRSFFRFAKNKNICFSRNEKSSSGALSQMFVDLDRSFRSTHPTNSIVAFGKHAESICSKHTEKSMSFDFIGSLIELNAKHLMLGTIDEKNAPAGFHYAQQLIGETKTTPGFGLLQSYFINANGEKKLFTRWDGGGCSGAGYKLIGHHLLDGCMNIGIVGKSFSALIDIRASVNVCKQALIQNRRFLKCDDNMCLTCNGRFSISGIYVFLFYGKFLFKKTPSLIRKIKKRFVSLS